ncbi:MAG: hypothetical protein AVDCRST_MAG26-3554 [uncultured Chloroflexia bacterium]|uniref:Uncharacterized protein n=1 Tax=uncultured Chloroflexia bacterium TaxID=1672391 RepID=A0A6J4JNT3_9CHLR|nr:MAG: hypothetical protein AVDCRST_MAG26-3554 [uncultured Chloroflexia bacterium]
MKIAQLDSEDRQALAEYAAALPLGAEEDKRMPAESPANIEQ